jgi:hypothetical protein
VRVVWKYVMGNDTTVDVLWPPGSRIVLIAAQKPGDYTPSVWIEHPRKPSDDDPKRTIAAFGSGHSVPAGVQHLGSAVCAHGQGVWHLYAEPVEELF